METAVAAVLLFAGASFFFALAETAFFSLSNWQVRQLAEKSPRSGKIVGELLGRPDDAMMCLERAVQNGFGHREWVDNDADLASLHGDPRFDALVTHANERPRKN